MRLSTPQRLYLYGRFCRLGELMAGGLPSPCRGHLPWESGAKADRGKRVSAPRVDPVRSLPSRKTRVVHVVPTTNWIDLISIAAAFPIGTRSSIGTSGAGGVNCYSPLFTLIQFW